MSRWFGAPILASEMSESDSSITGQLEAWFARKARDLPWRKRRTPWGVLVSEFMLQQTQVSRVIDRWQLFMQRFPTPAHLAAADEQDVLAAWQGLGYYRRAKHLRAAAAAIVERYDGAVPVSLADLLTLPGVGRYTAGAVASIAYGRPVPIVDANVRRVLSRLSVREDDGEWTWTLARSMVEQATCPATFNEGLMELGALVCTNSNPDCDACPLKGFCAAATEGRQDEFPAPGKRTPRKHVHHHALVLTCGDQIALEQRGDDGPWAGMWEVPTLESDSPIDATQVMEALGVDASFEDLGTFDHLLTHRHVTFHVLAAEVDSDDRFQWHPRWDLERRPMANAQRRVLDLAQDAMAAC